MEPEFRLITDPIERHASKRQKPPEPTRVIEFKPSPERAACNSCGALPVAGRSRETDAVSALALEVEFAGRRSAMGGAERVHLSLEDARTLLEALRRGVRPAVRT